MARSGLAHAVLRFLQTVCQISMCREDLVIMGVVCVPARHIERPRRGGLIMPLFPSRVSVPLILCFTIRPGVKSLYAEGKFHLIKTKLPTFLLKVLTARLSEYAAAAGRRLESQGLMVSELIKDVHKRDEEIHKRDEEIRSLKNKLEMTECEVSWLRKSLSKRWLT